MIQLRTKLQFYSFTVLQFYNYGNFMRNCITGFITLGYSTLHVVQQLYWLWKILLVYTLQSTILPDLNVFSRRADL